MAKKYSYFVLAIVFLSFNLFSEEKEKIPLPSLQYDIVVTATRLETLAKEIASSVTVITRKDLERMKKYTVLEVLQDVPGVTIIQNGPAGAAASVFLRGAKSEHTLILMDGIELNDPISPARSYDLAHLTLENIERIEIIRGPQSTLYGSDAIGGVVNIITRKGQGKPRFSLSSRGGSYKTFSAKAEVRGSAEKIDYSFGISHLSTQGISAASADYKGNTEKDGYQNTSLSGRVGFTPLDNLEIGLILRSISTKTDIDNFGGAYGDDPNNTQNYKSFFLKAQIRTLFLKNRWEQKLGLSFVNHDRQHQNPQDTFHPIDSEKGHFKSKMFKIDWQNNFFVHETNTLTFGIDYQQELGESEYHSDGIWGPFSSIFPLQRAHITGFYLQDQIRLAHQFFATAGVRLDIHSQFGSALTYRLAPAYLIETTGTKLKATYGTGFKSPSLYQLYAPGTAWGPIGNENLKPEKSTGWDFGIEQFFFDGKFLLGVTYFHNAYKDLVDFNFLQGYINVGKAESKGAEVYLQAQPIDELQLRATYTKLGAKDKITGTHLLRRPKNKFTASLNYVFLKKGNIHLSFVFIGKRNDIDFATWSYPQVSLPSYILFNASFSFDINSSIQIFGCFDNLFNQEYENILGYGTPGRSASAGVKLLH